MPKFSPETWVFCQGNRRLTNTLYSYKIREESKNKTEIQKGQRRRARDPEKEEDTQEMTENSQDLDPEQPRAYGGGNRLWEENRT